MFLTWNAPDSGMTPVKLKPRPVKTAASPATLEVFDNTALRRNWGKHLNIDDSVRWRFWLHSSVDTQRVDSDSGVAGVSGVAARTGRRGEDTETVGAAQARSQGV